MTFLSTQHSLADADADAATMDGKMKGDENHERVRSDSHLERWAGLASLLPPLPSPRLASLHTCSLLLASPRATGCTHLGIVRGAPAPVYEVRPEQRAPLIARPVRPCRTLPPLLHHLRCLGR